MGGTERRRGERKRGGNELRREKVALLQTGRDLGYIFRKRKKLLYLSKGNGEDHEGFNEKQSW